MERQDVGIRGRAYVQEALGAGATLSRLVREMEEPAAGSIWTFVPHGLVLNSLVSFTARIDWRGEQERITDRVFGRFREHLIDPTSWLVVEDRFMTAPEHDPEADFFFVGPNVYYRVTGGSPVDSIERTLRSASPWPFIGFLGLGGMPADLHSERSRPLAELETLAENTQTVIVGAFDEESYLFWDLGETA
jgi:hypothetical protein